MQIISQAAAAEKMLFEETKPMKPIDPALYKTRHFCDFYFESAPSAYCSILMLHLPGYAFIKQIVDIRVVSLHID